jgi:hypothetical protein
MTKLLIGLLGAAVVATGGYAAATGLESEPARTVSLPAATGDTTTNETTAGATTDEAGDISGPCDEAEHRNDPRCAGVTVPPPAPGTTGGTTGTTTGATTTDGDRDISGPCDEAEHRNDPRCTGAGDDDRDDDNSGRGRGGDDDRDDDNSGRGRGGDDDRGDDEDRSGSNSGKG